MKFFDVGQRAMGVIAIGQEATGVIAFGQMARGGIAIGQLAVGLVGWGQMGVGVFHAVGMFGAGGRGFGIVARLVPFIGRPSVLPQATSLAAIAAGESGWVDVELAPTLALSHAGAPVAAKLDRRLQTGARALTAEGPRRVLAHLRPMRGGLVCERIAYEPPRPHRTKGFWRLAAIQIVALVGLGTAWAAFAGHDLLVALDVISADGASPAPRPRPSRPARGRSR